MFGRLLLVLSSLHITYDKISSLLLKQTSRKFRGEDRISALSHDLLVEILSKLSTKEAVATMILSKRWHFLWKMVPKLWYKEESDEKQQLLWRFIEESLQLHKAPILEHLMIQLGNSSCPVPVDVDVGKWIEYAVDRKVCELVLTIEWSAEPARLCKSFYTCDTLVRLCLYEKVLVDVPSPACLPSLKTLFLYYVVYKDEDSLVMLLSNCPVLKFLAVCRSQPDNVKTLNIKSSSLEYLIYHSLMDGNSGSLVIDSPALKNIYFYDIRVDTCSIENMFCLHKADIYITFNPDDKFMKSLSSVKHLDLGLYIQTATWCNAINFSKLMKCKITLLTEFDWLETLMGILQNSPNLKLLFIDQTPIQFKEDFSLSWNEPSSVPKCLSSHLEIVQWNGYIGRKKEKEVIRYIFTNSRCLERAGFAMNLQCKTKHEEKMKELESMFRISTSSQLLFSNELEIPGVVDEMKVFIFCLVKTIVLF